MKIIIKYFDIHFPQMQQSVGMCVIILSLHFCTFETYFNRLFVDFKHYNYESIYGIVTFIVFIIIIIKIKMRVPYHFNLSNKLCRSIKKFCFRGSVELCSLTGSDVSINNSLSEIIFSRSIEPNRFS